MTAMRPLIATAALADTSATRCLNESTMELPRVSPMTANFLGGAGVDELGRLCRPWSCDRSRRPGRISRATPGPAVWSRQPPDVGVEAAGPVEGGHVVPLVAGVVDVGRVPAV